jgi:hypothetical protein
MKDIKYDISEGEERYGVRALLKASGRTGKENEQLADMIVKYGIVSDVDGKIRFKSERGGEGRLEVYALFSVNKSEFEHAFSVVRKYMDELVEKAQGLFWEAFEFGEKFLNMLEIARKMDLL